MKNRSLKLNTVLNVVKQLCSVLFPLITIPYVTRTLQATNYGKVNFSSSIISYFVLFAAFGINNYSIREGGQIRNRKEEFTKFASEVFSINCWTTFMSYIGLIGLLIFSVKIREYSLLIIIQSLSIILSTLGANWVNTIYEDYLFITIRYIVMQVISFVCLFVFVHKPEDYVVYTIIHVIATAGGNLFNIPYIRRYVKLKFTFNANFRKHMIPLLLLFFNEVAFAIYVNSDITILGILKTEQDVGIYSLAVKIYTVVKTILNSIITVSMPRLAAYLGEKRLVDYRKLCKKVFTSTLTLLLPAIIGMTMLAPNILYIVSGEEYVAGSISFRVLSVSLLFAVAVAFYGNCVLIPNRREKVCLIAACISAILNISLNFIIIPLISYNGAAITTLISEALTAFIYVVYSRKYLERVIEPRDALSIFIGSVSVGITCFIVEKSILSVYGSVVIAILLSVLVFFATQIILKNSIVVKCLESIFKKKICK